MGREHRLQERPAQRGTVQKLHAMLVNSPEHYANIVNGSFEEIGIGLKEADFNGKAVVLVTQNFGTPNGLRPMTSEVPRPRPPDRFPVPRAKPFTAISATTISMARLATTGSTGFPGMTRSTA
jgi:hypothetical protein